MKTKSTKENENQPAVLALDLLKVPTKEGGNYSQIASRCKSPLSPSI